MDLSRFTQEKIISVPIRNGKFLYHKKKYSIEAEDGWFKVKIVGNGAKVDQPIYDFSELEKEYKPVKGFSYNNSIVFQNFDVAKRKWSFGLSKEMHFNQAQSFSSIKAIVWEDKNIYFLSPNYTDYKIFEVKTVFDNDENLEDRKGITPELRTLFLFHSIERDQLRAMEKIRLEELVEEERKERERQMMATVQGRLQLTFNRVGARLINYNISGNRITVDWELTDMGQRYNSVIDSRTFKIIEAGYCMSGMDKDHNITSMIKLAEDYEERGLTYKTRN